MSRSEWRPIDCPHCGRGTHITSARRYGYHDDPGVEGRQLCRMSGKHVDPQLRSGPPKVQVRIGTYLIEAMAGEYRIGYALQDNYGWPMRSKAGWTRWSTRDYAIKALSRLRPGMLTAAEATTSVSPTSADGRNPAPVRPAATRTVFPTARVAVTP